MIAMRLRYDCDVIARALELEQAAAEAAALPCELHAAAVAGHAALVNELLQKGVFTQQPSTGHPTEMFERFRHVTPGQPLSSETAPFPTACLPHAAAHCLFPVP